MAKSSKLGLITLGSIVFLVLHLLTRVMLLAMVPAGSGLTLPLLVKIFAVGFYFDLATLGYVLLPMALYLLVAPRKLLQSHSHNWLVLIAFFVFSVLMIFNGVAEYFFFDEFGTRFNFIAVDYIVYTNEVIGNIRESYPLVPIFTAIGIVALTVTVVLRQTLKTAAAATCLSPNRRRLGWALLLPAVAVLLIVNISHSSISTNGFANELAGNGIYNLVAAFRNNELSFERFYLTKDEATVSRRMKEFVTAQGMPLVAPQSPAITRHHTATGPERRLNVIVVIEESFSAEFVGAYGSDRKLTPYLDRIAAESLVFTNLYATGTRTVRGLEALTLSMPPLPGTSIVKRPDNGGFRSWGEIMRAKGYDSSYIYAGYGYFDNMNAFYAGNGFRVVDRTDFAKDEITFANIWGVCDEDLFRKTIKEARQSHRLGKPFFSMVMTTSNHRPFTFPAVRSDIPTQGGGRDAGIKYADYAIGKLIEESRKEPWFKDTVFVIVADHCASSAGKTEIPVKKYEIPLFVYSPGNLQPGKIDRLMSQIDVAPTVLGLLNMRYDSDFFGQDILNPKGLLSRAFISTYQKLGYLTEDRLVVFSPQKQTTQYQLDRQTGNVKPMPLDDLLLTDALAYYQGASSIYTARLNRLATTPAANSGSRKAGE